MKEKETANCDTDRNIKEKYNKRLKIKRMRIER